MKIISFIFIKCVISDLVELEKYPGKHDNNYLYNTPITGSIVKDKIYTFGWCYPIPYIMEINNEDDIFNARLKKQNSINITDEIYIWC